MDGSIQWTATGNIGVHAKNSEILWDAGEVDADTMDPETATGTIQSDRPWGRRSRSLHQQVRQQQSMLVRTPD